MKDDCKDNARLTLIAEFPNLDVDEISEIKHAVEILRGYGRIVQADLIFSGKLDLS